MEIRRLHAGDAAAYWQLRLEALENDAQAFAEAPAEHRKATVREIAQRLQINPEDSFVLGVFVDGQLAGMVGFRRGEREKTRHSGHVWGVYVRGEHRSKGTGKALMAALIERARSISGLEQLTLAVGTGQAAAMKLYLSFGFKAYGREPHCLKVGDDYVDMDHMVLNLAGSAAPKKDD